MTTATLLALNILFWPILQIAISTVCVRLPDRFFSLGFIALPPQRWEHPLYRTLRVRHWKKWLPDAAWIVGGTRKHLEPYRLDHVLSFVADTRRAEFSHCLQLACTIFCWRWNPRWAALTMTAYALLANLPCILAQRYNRLVLMKRKASHSKQRACAKGVSAS